MDTQQKYATLEPDVILVHQLPKQTRALRMLELMTNLNFGINNLHPRDIETILAVTKGHIHGPLGDLRRIALLMQEEAEKSEEYIRPEYWHKDQPGLED